MDHRQIEDDAVVERYVRDALGPDERIAFEEHLMECPECVESLGWAEDFRGALRTAAAESAAPSPARRRVPARSSMLLPIAAGIAAMALPLTLVARHAASLREQLARSEASGSEWKTRYEGERRSAEAAQQGLQQAMEPRANVPAVLLSAVRGAAARPVVLSVPRDAAWVVVSIELEPTAEHVSHRARLLGPDGRELWRAEGLRPASPAPVSLLLPSRLLAAGEHRIEVEGLRRDGRSDIVGVYAFRVVPGNR
jgi:hypothetical protein